MATSRFNWTEEYCKAVKHYLSTAERTPSNRLKKGEIERISSTLGINLRVLRNGMNVPNNLLHTYLQTGVYVKKRGWSEEELKILASFVIENSDNLRHAFRCTALKFRATGIKDMTVSSITAYYYTHMKKGERLFNLVSLEYTFRNNVKNNIAKGQSTIGVR